MQECTCYEYPNPDKPVTPPGTGGGGTGGGANPGNEIKSNVELMNKDNFVGYDVSHDCMAGCKAIMDNYKVGYGGSNHVYQLLVEDDGKLVYYETIMQRITQMLSIVLIVTLMLIDLLLLE